MRPRFTKPFRPHTFYLAVFAGMAGLLFVGIDALIFIDPPLRLFVSLAVSTFLLYGLDKAMAVSGAMRVPETVLFVAALIGGAPGALAGMHVFRHKTRKPVFIAVLAAILMVQIVVVALYLRS